MEAKWNDYGQKGSARGIRYAMNGMGGRIGE